MSPSTAAWQSASPDTLAEPRDWDRLRFTACIALYGATVGGCGILVNLLSRVSFPEVPQHMSFGVSLLLGCVGASAGAIVTAPIAYWVYGRPPAFSLAGWGRRGPRGWIPWLSFGLVNGLAYPPILGISLQLALLSAAAWERLITPSELTVVIIDLAVRIPVFAISGAFEFLFTGITAALVFGVGARTIGILNSSTGVVTARYGTAAIAIGMSLAVAALLTFVPEATLARFGGLR